jgi:1-acyl-sn-glycerol-3-phosphate acyltransferase
MATKTTLYSAWIWATLVLGAMLGFCVLLPLTLVSRPFDPTRRLAGSFFRRLARRLVQLSGLWRFQAVPPYPPRLDGPFVVVSNHESHLDAFLISFLPYEMKWLAKDSLFKLPFIGWNMALAGDIPVVRGRGRSVDRAMGRCRQLLAQGMPVFLFPEGTRAHSEAMLPFKDGAFRLALEAQCPVLPLAVAGTSRGLRKNSWRFYPSEAQVRVGEPVAVAPLLAKIADPHDPMTFDDALLELKEATRMQVSTLRAALRQNLGLVRQVPHAPPTV